VSTSVLDMSMSLDGFIAGPEDREGQELGRDGGRLFNWLDDRMSDGPNGQVFRELMATGALISGRRTFVLTRHDPDDLRRWPLITFANDVTTAMTQAKKAAGNKNVVVHGAGTAQLALAAGVLDEIELHLIPVLLGQRRRLFDHLAAEHIELERTKILEGENGVTHLHYRVQR
jgi:dihydrofolate reductase